MIGRADAGPCPPMIRPVCSSVSISKSNRLVIAVPLHHSGPKRLQPKTISNPLIIRALQNETAEVGSNRLIRPHFRSRYGRCRPQPGDQTSAAAPCKATRITATLFCSYRSLARVLRSLITRKGESEPQRYNSLTARLWRLIEKPHLRNQIASRQPERRTVCDKARAINPAFASQLAIRQPERRSFSNHAGSMIGYSSNGRNMASRSPLGASLQ